MWGAETLPSWGASQDEIRLSPAETLPSLAETCHSAATPPRRAVAGILQKLDAAGILRRQASKVSALRLLPLCLCPEVWQWRW